MIHDIVSEMTPVRADCQPKRRRIPAWNAENARYLVASKMLDSRDDELGRWASPNMFTYHGVAEDASFLRVELETASVCVRGEGVEGERSPACVELVEVWHVNLPVVKVEHAAARVCNLNTRV